MAEDDARNDARHDGRADGHVIFLYERTIAETVALLEQARNQLAAGAWSPVPAGSEAPDPVGARLLVMQEAFRVTTRLTRVMAWLLARAAVRAGEMTADEARRDWRLGSTATCRDRGGEALAVIPAGLRDMLQRSHALYMRTARIDALTGDAPASPRTALPRAGDRIPD